MGVYERSLQSNQTDCWCLDCSTEEIEDGDQERAEEFQCNYYPPPRRFVPLDFLNAWCLLVSILAILYGLYAAYCSMRGLGIFGCYSSFLVVCPRISVACFGHWRLFVAASFVTWFDKGGQDIKEGSIPKMKCQHRLGYE
jgi:hypothetical protein